MRDKPSVCVLGAGPAGLLAAWGAVQEGCSTLVIADRDTAYKPERIFSLQFLHDPCGLDFAARRIQLHYDQLPKIDGMPFIQLPNTPKGKIYVFEGKSEAARMVTKHAYNIKLGRPMEEENSTRFLWESPTTVWSLKEAYTWLYRTFATAMIKDEVDFDRILNVCENYDLVISTIPLDILFPQMEWPVRRMWIARDYTPPETDLPDNTCTYNLDPNVPWFRATRLDGGSATEFVGTPDDPFKYMEWVRANMYPPLDVLRKVIKATKYPPLPSNLVLAGRWGTWDPKALTHDAYRIARNAVREIGARTV